MKNVFIFLIGTAAGSLVTWKFVEEKYKKLADEEIESVKKVFKERQEKISDIASSKNSYGAYKDIIKDLSYGDEEKQEEDKPKADVDLNKIQETLNFNVDKTLEEVKTTEVVKDEIDRSKPYVISPEEFGEVFGYETKSWTYYADDILVDEFDQIVEDPELFIGDALKHFGEYEDDSVFVRDEKSSIDYEILRVTEEFSKIF